MSEREQELISEKQERTLREIGSGFGAKIYLVERPSGERLAKKVFDPNKVARIAYRIYRWREPIYGLLCPLCY